MKQLWRYLLNSNFNPDSRSALISAGSSASSKRLLEIGDDVVDMLSAHGDTDGVLRGAGSIALILRELLVGCGPRVDGEGLGVTDTGGEFWLE